MASLILLKTPDGSATGERVTMNYSAVIISSSPEECQVVLPPNAVRGKHAQITVNEGNYFIEDLGSRNKTLLNNEEVTTRTALKDGDGIKICDFLFGFRDQNRPKPPKQKDDEGDETGGSTTFEATFQRASNQQFLDLQPADKLKAILRISSVLSKTLDIKHLWPQIAEELFELFRSADRC